MKRLLRASLVVSVFFAFASAPLAWGQTVTTGALSGTVLDESGGVLPGASVEALHEPTGSRYSAVTGTDGHYSILNVRVGGPYSVSVTMSGFNPQKQAGIQVAL